MVLIYVVLITCLLFASIFDAIKTRIPNLLSLTILVSGLSGNALVTEGLGLKGSIMGLAIGLLLMLPSYVLASMGAGDVKFMAAIGSVIGADKVLDVVYYSYMCMFIMAITLIIVRGDLFRLLLRLKVLFNRLFIQKSASQIPDTSDVLSYRLPLAPAIVLATFYVIYPKICNLGLLEVICHY